MRRWIWLTSALFFGCWERVDYIEIKPTTLVLKQKTNEIWLQGHAMSHTGVHATRAKIAWSTRDPSVAVVDEKGRLTPVKSGRTEVVAKHGDVEASSPVDVLFTERVTVEPNPVRLQEGGSSVELQVRAFDYQGRELKERTATFKSLDKEVLSMGQNAAFPVNAGKTQVEVQIEDVSLKIDVIVDPEPKGAKKQ